MQGGLCLAEKELAKRSLTSIMPEEAYKDRSYEWEYADWWPDWWYDVFVKGSGYPLITSVAAAEQAMLMGEAALRFHTGNPATVKNYAEAKGVPNFKVVAFTDPPSPTMAAIGAIGHSALAKAPHPNAALVFVNYVTGKEFLDWYLPRIAETDPQSSIRRDVPYMIEEKYWAKPEVASSTVTDPKWYEFEGYGFGKRTVAKLMREGMSREAWKKAVRDDSMLFWGQYPPPPGVIQRY